MTQVGDVFEDNVNYYVAEEAESGILFLVPLIGMGVKAGAKALTKHGVKQAKKKALAEAQTREERKGIRTDAKGKLADVRAAEAASKASAKPPKGKGVAGDAKTGFVESQIGLTSDVGRIDPHPVVPHPARMRVVLKTHGGQEGLADVMEGLVRRNVRSIRAGKVPRAPEKATHPSDPIWRDAVSATRDKVISPGTLAAWRAAEARVFAGDAVASICFESGRPAFVSGSGSVVGFVGSPSVKVAQDHGRSNQFMVLAIDDNSAFAVRDMGDAISRHNAKRIKSQGLPELYKSGVYYKTEGSPEHWWDAEEILAHGHDDCEGLSAYRAGELINAGYVAGVYTRLIEGPATGMGGNGPRSRLFHAVTKAHLPDGSYLIDDPSAVLGMPTPEWYIDYAAKRRAQGLPL